MFHYYIWHKKENNYNLVRKPQIDVRWMPVVGRAIFEKGNIFKWILAWHSLRNCCKGRCGNVPKTSNVEKAGNNFNVLENKYIKFEISVQKKNPLH